MLTKLYEERLRRDIFKLAVISLITVLIWVGVGTYRALTKSESKPNLKKQIKPLTADLPVDTMEKITGRQQIVEADWNSLKPASRSILVLPSPVASPSGQNSPSGELESLSATESGSL